MAFPAFTPAQLSLRRRWPSRRLGLVALALAAGLPVVLFATAMVILLANIQEEILERSIVEVARSASAAADLVLTDRAGELRAASVGGGPHFLPARSGWIGAAVPAGTGWRELGPNPVGPLVADADFEVKPVSDNASYAVVTDKAKGPALVIRLGAGPPGAPAVYGALDLKQVPLLAGVAVPEMWRVSVIDPKQRIIASSPEPEQFLGRTASRFIVNQLEHDRGGLFSAVDNDGLPVSTVAMRSPRSGMAALVEVPERIAAAAVREKVLAIGTGGIAAAILAGGLLWFLISNIHSRQEAERQTLRANAAREIEQRLAYIAADFPGEIFRRVLRPDGTLHYPLLRGRSMDLLPRQADLHEGAQVTELAKAYIHPEDAERWQAAILESAATLEPYDIEWRPLSPVGEERWVRSMARAGRAADGSVIWDGISLDITAQKRNEAALKREIEERREVERHQSVLIAELNHRVRNTLAIILAIAQQTVRSATDLESFSSIFSGRIQALAQAHTLLSEKDWTSTTLIDVVREAIAPYDLPRGRVHLVGDPVEIAARPAIALSLTFHELATNAGKYGSLSSETGTVDITWWVEGGRLHIVWAEKGGPPCAAPSRRGFGAMLIQMNVEQELSGVLQQLFGPDGFRCEMTLPLDKLVKRAPVFRMRAGLERT
jgi:two-component sensor histidine kinase